MSFTVKLVLPASLNTASEFPDGDKILFGFDTVTAILIYFVY